MFRSLVLRGGKDVRFGDEARRCIQKGVSRAVAAVATTLGPKGRNVIIEQSYGAPKITKDGVTVAKSIEFKDPFENMGAQLVRQVCNKTNDLAGDGTTTSAVLVDSIFGEGLKCIAQGTNPIDMKRGMDRAVEVILKSVAEQSRPVQGTENIVQVATISANGDAEIGKMIGTAMEKVGRDGVITSQDGKTMATELEIVEGMSVDRGYISPYFITDSKTQKAELEDAFLLVSTKKIQNIHSLLPTLNHVARSGKPLLIIADDVESEALTTLIFNKLQGKLKVCCVKAPGFGDNKTAILQDIAIFSGAQLVGDEGTGLELDAEKFDPAILGTVKKLTVTKDDTVLLNGGGDAAAVKERVDLLRAHIEKETSDYNKEKMQERLAKLSGGVAVIKVGGASEVEVGEKKDRIEDALCATRAAVQEGIVAGGGAALLRASVQLEPLEKDESLTRDQRTGVTIVRNAIRLPAVKIAANAGKEGAVVVEKVLENKDVAVGYDAQKDRYVNMFEAGIIDPARVVRVAITDATSVASMMMTAEAAVVDLPKEDIPPQKNNDNNRIRNTRDISNHIKLPLSIIIIISCGRKVSTINDLLLLFCFYTTRKQKRKSPRRAPVWRGDGTAPAALLCPGHADAANAISVLRYSVCFSAICYSGLAPGAAVCMDHLLSTVQRGLPSGNLEDPRSRRRLEPRGGVPAWVPTKLTSPYKVLTAGVLQNDFYASCISWGRENIAVGLTSEVLVLHQERTRFITKVSDVVDGHGSDAAKSKLSVRPTTVSVLRCSEAEVFLGLSSGSTYLLEGREDGTFARRQTFDMPPNPLAETLRPASLCGPTGPWGDAGAGEQQRCRDLLSQHADAIFSAGCSATCAVRPHEVIVGTSSGSLVLLDVRSPTPALVLGKRELFSEFVEQYDGIRGQDSTIIRLTSSLLRHERLCAASWSANGSYIATGGSSGLVTIWSVSSPRRPLHRLVADAECAAKGVVFHPENPYEIALGNSAGPSAIRTYDISGAPPRLTHAGPSSTPITQLVYSPDGGHLVSAHGSLRSAVSRANLRAYLPSPLGLLHTAGATDGSLVAEVGLLDLTKSLRGGPALVLPPEPTTSAGTADAADHAATQPHCLAVWRRGRANLHPFRSPCLPPDTTEGPAAALPLHPAHILTGHKDRPLYLATPYAGSAQCGHVASASGGRDKSLRFWKGEEHKVAAVNTPFLDLPMDKRAWSPLEAPLQNLALLRANGKWGKIRFRQAGMKKRMELMMLAPSRLESCRRLLNICIHFPSAFLLSLSSLSPSSLI
eukprot:gene5130-3683_t